MKVQEAIQLMKSRVETATELMGKGIDGKAYEDMEMAIEALEEVEQYRALEEKLNGISVEHIVNAFIERVEKDTNEGYEKGRILTNAEADMWEQYKALGTVEELKEAREKQKSRREWYQKGYQDGLNADKWIPCEERLPIIEEEPSEYAHDIGERYLITDSEGYVYESTFWKGENDFGDYAIAWMPKPQPYKKEGAENAVTPET